MDFEELWKCCDQVYGNATIEEGQKIIFCPDCEEPIIAEDYEGNGLCPHCEFNFNDDL